MFGSKGLLEMEYDGLVIIRGENFYRGGQSPGIYEEVVVANIETFYQNITKANYTNETVAPSVRSNLITILSRTAAYQKSKITWDQLLSDNEKLDYDLRGLKNS